MSITTHRHQIICQHHSISVYNIRNNSIKYKLYFNWMGSCKILEHLIAKTYKIKPTSSALTFEDLKSWSEIYGWRKWSFVKALKVPLIWPYPWLYSSSSYYFKKMPVSGYFPVPIMHWALVTGGLQLVSTFRFCESGLSLWWNPLFINMGIFMPSDSAIPNSIWMSFNVSDLRGWCT